MTESSDIRSLLTAKSRAKVPPRDISLGRKKPVAQEPVVEEELPAAQQEPVPPKSDDAPGVAADLSGLQNELEDLPQMGKRLAVHLEQGIRGELVQLCDQKDITPEIFVEAAFALMRDRPELIEEVVSEAKVRLAQRKRAGLIRRTIAMAQKYGS